MKKLIIIRHGEAEHIIQNMIGGWTDTALTEKGKKQADLTGEYLLKILTQNNIDKDKLQLYSSDLKRAKETAEMIGGKMGLIPILKTELREFNNGIAVNLPKDEADKIMKPIVCNPYIDIDWQPFEEGETWRLLNQRINHFMDEINESEDGNVIMVSHGGAIVHLIHWWLNLPFEYINRITYGIDPCSISILGITKFQEKVIEKLNDTSHLSGNETFGATLLIN